jgi:hypothetical protein
VVLARTKEAARVFSSMQEQDRGPESAEGVDGQGIIYIYIYIYGAENAEDNFRVYGLGFMV